MKVLILPLLILTLSAKPWRELALADLCPRERTWTIYEAACYGTCVPPETLRAVAITESDETCDAVSPDGLDEGFMQLRRTYHAERVALLGREFSPFDPQDACRVAALILDGHYREFDDWDLALSAYNQGAGMTRKVGRNWKYLERIYSVFAMRLCGTGE
jgi:hypothetical protein